MTPPRCDAKHSAEAKMKVICPKHGSSLHYHVCRHVKEACDAGGPLPDIDLTAKALICRDCLTPEVSELLRLTCMLNLGESEESIQRFFDAHDALQLKIGFRPLCTDCLYEKTGVVCAGDL